MDAVFASISISRKIIAVTIKLDVRIIATSGVLNRSFTRAKKTGSRRSLLIAIGERDAASIPAFAVVTNAATAAIAIITNPNPPRNLAAAVDIGV